MRGIGLSNCAEEVVPMEIAKDQPFQESVVKCVFKVSSSKIFLMFREKGGWRIFSSKT